MDSDRDFTPTADMLVHEYDDEATLDEEEEIETGDSQFLELQDLQREQDIPLEELLSMYGYNIDESSSDDVQNLENRLDEVTNYEKHSGPKRKDVSNSGEPREHSKSRSKLRYLRGESHIDLNSDNDEDDEDDLFRIEDEEKSVRTGNEFQASVPAGFDKYDITLPYENEDKKLWDPCALPENEVEQYLNLVRDMKFSHPKNEGSRKGDVAKKLSSVFKSRKRSRTLDSTTSRDDEQALYLLLQCGFNVEEALRRQRLNMIPQTNMSLWSEDECLHFENGLCSFGKDFHQIQLHKVRTRSVDELVQFYYFWKKSERHDIFISNFRMEKKKYYLHPQITDFMEKCNDEPDIEEQPDSGDSGDSSESSNGEFVYNSSSSGANRPLRHDDLRPENSVTLLKGES